MKYRVFLAQTVVEEAQVVVEAASREAAVEAALKLAYHNAKLVEWRWSHDVAGEPIVVGTVEAVE